ncbi:MAG: GatB/YqeY domain-containing protein [Candidatus Omnitrophica bacterium]|jgi:Uncharacterized conserved protein|nr:GatB/YqeY domain-containing protein [Candidatus Omnitrophota bacterium]
MLEKKIYDDYVQSLKSGQKQKAQFLNFVRAGLKNAAISLKKDALDDTEVLAALKKEQKRLEETKETGIAAAKPEVVAQAEREIAILLGYLPRPMDAAELQKIVDQVIAATNAVSMKDMGRVMKEIMAQAGAGADAGTVSAMVKKKLSGAV